MYRSYADSGRAKRDLDVDPEELLALMTLLEAERKQKVHEQSRHVTDLHRICDIEIYVYYSVAAMVTLPGVRRIARRNGKNGEHETSLGQTVHYIVQFF